MHHVPLTVFALLSYRMCTRLSVNFGQVPLHVCLLIQRLWTTIFYVQVLAYLPIR
jgi:hypothetical protein